MSERLAINYQLLPEGLRGGMQRYIELGILPGHFLQAVLRSNLAEAFERADEINTAALPDILRFMNDEAPADCWGSKEKMEAWVKARKGGQIGDSHR